MKNIKKLMSLALFMTMAMTTDVSCKSNNSVTFTNNSSVNFTLTGPRGSKTLQAGQTATIKPKTNPVNYTVSAPGFSTYSGEARAGASYNICNEDGAIVVQAAGR